MAKRSILIINPNTTASMTDNLKPLIDSLGFGETTQFAYFTAPSGVPSINDEYDAAISTDACLPTLKEKLAQHDALLVCCYSQHPLVSALRDILREKDQHQKLVAGIFEASIASCLQLLTQPGEKFGIVSTGKQWEGILDDAMAELFGVSDVGRCVRYAGTETTGLNADELHSTPRAEVDARMKAAVQGLLGKGDVGAVCLGCAGMVGLERVVREGCVEALGEDRGRAVRIVDGVVAGVCFLEGALRAGL